MREGDTACKPLKKERGEKPQDELKGKKGKECIGKDLLGSWDGGKENNNVDGERGGQSPEGGANCVVVGGVGGGGGGVGGGAGDIWRAYLRKDAKENQGG